MTRIRPDPAPKKNQAGVWGLVFAVNQLVTVFTGRPPAIAMMMLIISTGLVIGNNGSLLVRYLRVRPVS